MFHRVIGSQTCGNNGKPCQCYSEYFCFFFLSFKRNYSLCVVTFVQSFIFVSKAYYFHAPMRSAFFHACCMNILTSIILVFQS